MIIGKEYEASRNVLLGQDSEQVGTFVHAPLEHGQGYTGIHLLQICNDSTEDEIRLTIYHSYEWENDDAITYTCLSYRWGDGRATRRIFVDGKAKYVRENLFDFLATWTRKGQDVNKWFWIDALCIDQNNAAERNHQVQEMGNIYATAKEVIIWLGKHAASDQYLCAVFSTLRQQVLSNNDSICRTPDQDQAFHEAGELLSDMIWNEYWNRAWILQEVLLAREKTLAMNDQTISLETFFQSLDDYGISSGQGDNACLDMKEVMSKPQDTQGLSLICLLSQFRNRLCSVPRDRVFSLLSICTDGYQFEVDYEIPTEELIQDMPVWTDTIDKHGERKTIIACTYGDGFEFLRKGFLKKDFEGGILMRKHERFIRGERPNTLAAMFEEDFEEDVQVQMPTFRCSKSKVPPWFGPPRPRAAASRDGPPRRDKILLSERIDLSGRPGFAISGDWLKAKNIGGPVRNLSEDGILTELGKVEQGRLTKSAAATATKEERKEGKSVLGSAKESSS
ncbi:uncharacterized protein N0V89_001578 [Didymosphaeria variabile]|uniref:Heterokaryon incompatibility domain-containing protein n=1 Tax=Didymosphaeria variabile TaxID=1932322 RepID=A0A9W9CGT4_9PLEO|nr:uncharacterized protein N0V89_001578 [Didymosphaeria variabile]KAJ4361009.1 hypothetical protein N0V89_001578 [Didymosphaeria variabile]